MVNKDGSTVTKTFGYSTANGQGATAGTPFSRTAKSSFDDNKEHSFDESVTKQITSDQFSSILTLAEGFEKKDYNICSNNCTDFALGAAKIAGIDISDTKGSWLLGTQSGNTPADAGQSILDGKVTNTSTGDKSGLIIDVQNAKEAIRKNENWY